MHEPHIRCVVITGSCSRVSSWRHLQNKSAVTPRTELKYIASLSNLKCSLQPNGTFPLWICVELRVGEIKLK